MASITKRPDGKWRARYRDPGGREHARHFARKVDAEKWLDGIRGDLVHGVYIDPAAGRRAFGPYADEWQAMQVHRASTRAQVEGLLRLHLLPAFRDRPLGAVRPSEVQAWVRGLSDQLSPGTVKLCYQYLSAIFRAAVADRLIPSSPCVKVKLPRVERKRVTPMATETVAALVDAVQPRYRALIVLGAGTGVRQGEAFGLTVDRVDFLRRTVRIDRQLVRLPGQPATFGPPKTAASVRTIPLPRVVVDALAAHLTAFPVGPDSFIFTNKTGQPLTRSSFSDHVWRPAARKVGLPAGVTFHDLRHYYASLLIRHAESVKTVQARLGHANAGETLDTYSHLWPDSEDRTRDAVDHVLGLLDRADDAAPLPAAAD